jgi:hypothetical protein
MSAPALVGNALVLHSLCYSIAPLPCFPPLFFDGFSYPIQGGSCPCGCTRTGGWGEAEG